MRKALRDRDGERLRIRAKVECLGKRPTVLLIDGVNAVTGEALFDHLWMTTGVWARVTWRENDWRALRPGDVIEFDARSSPYLKGYFGYKRHIDRPAELDWKVARPTKVVLVQDSLLTAAQG